MPKFGLAALALATMGGMSQAADEPSLLGTWTGPGQGAGREGGWTNDAMTLEITGQRGRAFVGRETYDKGEREDFFGIVAGDGRTVYIVDGDGQQFGTLTAPDTLDICYLESGPDAEAACWVLKRAP